LDFMGGPMWEGEEETLADVMTLAAQVQEEHAVREELDAALGTTPRAFFRM